MSLEDEMTPVLMKIVQLVDSKGFNTDQLKQYFDAVLDEEAPFDIDTCMSIIASEMKEGV